MGRQIFLFIVIACVAALGWLGWERYQEVTAAPVKRAKNSVVPVEVTAIARTSLENRRNFSGTFEANAEFIVAAKAGGRVTAMRVDLADAVTRGDLVAQTSDDEIVQTLARTKAALLVADANLFEARSLVGISERELGRVKKLVSRGIMAASNEDSLMTAYLTRKARVAVTEAEVMQARSAVESANIRFAETRIHADWKDGGNQRIVSERLVNVGETVDANDPLLRLVEIDPVLAVFTVTERDYPLFTKGQAVRLRTDAYTDAEFEGSVSTIGPVFTTETRQARIEIAVANPDQLLKPGMLARATVILDRVTDAIVVPASALTRRRDETGIFVLNEDGKSVRWQVVTPGIQDGDNVQLVDAALSGQVVVLGQQLLKPGSKVNVLKSTARTAQ